MAETGNTNSGLEGVVVADTRLSEVDGERGRLIIAGRDVESLAGEGTFEDACALLWSLAAPAEGGREPGSPLRVDAGALRASLGQARADAFVRLDQLGDALAAEDGSAALRTAIGHIPSGPAAPFDLAEAARLTGAMAVFAAAWSRRQRNLAPLAPDPSLGHATDYLRMILGTAPTTAATRGMNAYLVTISDHGMNASTFAARVVASTGSDAVSAITAAVGALKGPLHGGAPGPVLDMLDAIGTPDRAVSFLEGELLAGRRIMGMGHRVYRVRDPRAAVLERALLEFERGTEGVREDSPATTPGGQAPRAPGMARLDLARAVESAAVGVLRARHPNRPLHANVEFYTAVLLDALGLPRTLFTPTFGVGRVAGWYAHYAEQRATGRLIRPASRYVGPPV